MTSQKTLESLKIVGSSLEVCCRETVFQDNGEEFASQLWRTTFSSGSEPMEFLTLLEKHVDSPESLQRVKDVLGLLSA